MNILIVDDDVNNIDVLTMLIEEYIEEENIEGVNIITESKSTNVLDIVINNQIDILFLDIMMPVLSGFDILQMIRNNQDIHQPIIIMQTALGDEETKQEEEKLGANAYMVKPLRYDVVKIMLDKYLKVDFDDFDFDFDDEDLDKTDNNSNLLESVTKKSYEHISAVEFLQSYEYMIDEINGYVEDIEILIYEIYSDDEEFDIVQNLDKAITIFMEFEKFLGYFIEFDDLQSVIGIFVNILNGLSLDNLNEKQIKNISKFIKNLIYDLIEFKEHIFVKQDANNIYYLNASFASSCLQIKYILKG